MVYRIYHHDPTTLSLEEWSQLHGILPNKWNGHRSSEKLPLRPSDLTYRNFFFYGFVREKFNGPPLPTTLQILKV
jgi:hypothetical protein